MENCSCVYLNVDGLPDVHTATERVARKEHQCCECGRTISPKEKYEDVSGKWEHGWDKYKTCGDCLSIRKEMFCDGWFYTMMYENLHEHVQELDGAISEKCLLSLTKDARSALCAMIDNYWSEE